MVFHTFYLLIVLMPFPGNEYDIAFLRKGAGGSYGFLAVHNRYYTLFLLVVETCKHVVYYVLRFLIARVVRREYHFATALDRLNSHHGAFPFIAVAAGSYYSNDVALTMQNLVYCTKYVL